MWCRKYDYSGHSNSYPHFFELLTFDNNSLCKHQSDRQETNNAQHSTSELDDEAIDWPIPEPQLHRENEKQPDTKKRYTQMHNKNANKAKCPSGIHKQIINFQTLS